MADIIGKAEITIRQYESGKIQIPNDVLQKIASALDTNIAYLLDWEERFNPDGILSRQVKMIEDVHSIEGKAFSSIIEQALLLNETGLEKAADYISDLAEQEKYRK